MAKKLRKGKVFVDWSQNDEHKTTVAAYSLRARERPTASTPLSWRAVEAGAATADPTSPIFSPAQVIERVQTHGDLFAPILDLKQKLPEIPATGE